jgi:hypothetical protein
MTIRMLICRQLQKSVTLILKGWSTHAWLTQLNLNNRDKQWHTQYNYQIANVALLLHNDCTIADIINYFPLMSAVSRGCNKVCHCSDTTKIEKGQPVTIGVLSPLSTSLTTSGCSFSITLGEATSTNHIYLMGEAKE